MQMSPLTPKFLRIVVILGRNVVIGCSVSCQNDYFRNVHWKHTISGSVILVTVGAPTLRNLVTVLRSTRSLHDTVDWSVKVDFHASNSCLILIHNFLLPTLFNEFILWFCPLPSRSCCMFNTLSIKFINQSTNCSAALWAAYYSHPVRRNHLPKFSLQRGWVIQEGPTQKSPMLLTMCENGNSWYKCALCSRWLYVTLIVQSTATSDAKWRHRTSLM